MTRHDSTTDTRPVAGLARRFLALCIDWAVATAISAGFFAWDAMATLAIFAVMTILLVGTLSATMGHVALGLGVRTLAGGPAGIVRAIVRTVALCLVIPAVVWGRDGRGLHDVWAGTVVTRVR